MSDTKKGIIRFYIFAWIFMCGPVVTALFSMWVFPEQYRDYVAEERQYVPDDNRHLLWQQDNIVIEDSLFTVNKNTLIVYRNQSSVSGYLTAIDVYTGQEIWQTTIATPSIVKRLNNVLLVGSYSSQYSNAPTTNEHLKDCSAFGSTHIAALNINDGEPHWQYKYSGASPFIEFRIHDNTLYAFGTDDHGASWSRIDIDPFTGHLIRRDCSDWPWEHKSRPIYPVDESQNIQADRVFVFSESETQIGDYYEVSNAYTEGSTLKIFDGNEKMTILIFEGEDLNSLQTHIAVINEIWLIYLQDSHQLFAFEFDEPPQIPYLK